ncbi:SDR family oxidoreductase [Parabacteroides sp. BX2]|jgi:NAD(P)-dependent dehydrogenase (short-subunit alcohol dehydrogenase family)|uniref:SDR family oxidoreductase n=1 Tax=Parabacteroides segnis TaxID=2763058 RepID=A0ABR7DZ43_9BACT|nr:MULTISPECIES: SDR family oxidoreductase [Parabacteroides]MBC5642777.1 SDR family oxidoreductase [Parabacteroides segnis]MCM0713805.1 SDR family oxidoreductase [Parabacteroides sp. TA-V-105]
MCIFTLKGKTALITGGGTGIGLGIAEQFVKAGAKVVITGRRENILKEAVCKLGNSAYYFVHDATQLSSIDNLLSSIEKEVAPVDILVNNAGRHLKKEVLDITDEQFAQVIELNLNTVFAFSREFARHCVRRNQPGNILLISSMSALVALDGVTAYAASKAGLQGLILGLTADLSRQGIRVNAIAPGFIESEMMLDIMKKFPEREKKVKQRILLDRWGLPEDIGKAALFLCSDAASYVTGVILPVDGGMSHSF